MRRGLPSEEIPTAMYPSGGFLPLLTMLPSLILVVVSASESDHKVRAPCSGDLRTSPFACYLWNPSQRNLSGTANCGPWCTWEEGYVGLLCRSTDYLAIILRICVCTCDVPRCNYYVGHDVYSGPIDRAGLQEGIY